MGINYEHEKVRSNIVLHYGDIPQATWSNNFNTIQEANIGVKLAKNLWIDAGFFATHIGTESFLPKNNFLSSTAFKTFNEPFYQAGVKLTYTTSEWKFQLWVLNGYNNFVDNNDAKSVGAFINYDFSPSTSLTYTNIYGRESEDNSALEQNRFYQNIYINHNWKDKTYITVGFDFGTQTNSDLQNTQDTAYIYAALITLRQQFSSKFSVTGRAEIFRDNNGFISGILNDTTNNLTGVDLTGFTIGTEYKPINGSYFRAEFRHTNTQDDLKIFVNSGDVSSRRLELLFTLGLEVEKIFQF